MTTTEKNIVIADFVGLRKVKCILNENGRYFDYELNNNFELIIEQEIQIESNNGFGLVSQDYVFAEYLVFHSNWAWLMKVIEKIETLEIIQLINGIKWFPNFLRELTLNIQRTLNQRA